MKRHAMWIAAALLCIALPAAGKSYVVDQHGGGDYATIGDALKRVSFDAVPDTVVVRAGQYAEHITFPQATMSVITCPSGPDSTTVLGSALDASDDPFYGPQWTVKGLGVIEKPLFWDTHQRLWWERCKFRGGVEYYVECGPANFTDCDFYAPTQLRQYNGVFTSLRFHHAPLIAEKWCGDMGCRDCLFEGLHGDTLVNFTSGEDMWFESCLFTGGSLGLITHSGGGGRSRATSCVFRDLDIGVFASGPEYSYNLGIDHNRFERCACAIREDIGDLWLTADTVIACGDRAIAVGASSTLDSMVVEGGAGVGIDLSTANLENGSSTRVTNSTFRNVAGTALRIGVATMSGIHQDLAVTGNRFENCGAGAEIAATWFDIEKNVVLGCAGRGIALWAMAETGYPVWNSTLANNTVALNLGDGIALFGKDLAHEPQFSLSRNISAQNGGAGFRVGVEFAGTFANNDSWQNYGAEYAGLTPNASNLVLDPMFCGLVNGDLTVSVGSPCAPNMPTGPMGALGVGCDQNLLGVGPATPALAFGVRPSPARGSLEFALPALAGAARVEVLDAQGRRVWSAPVAAGARTVQWRGELDRGGSAGAGIYWARVVRAGAAPTARRFVWLK